MVRIRHDAGRGKTESTFSFRSQRWLGLYLSLAPLAALCLALARSRHFFDVSNESKNISRVFWSAAFLCAAIPQRKRVSLSKTLEMDNEFCCCCFCCCCFSGGYQALASSALRSLEIHRHSLLRHSICGDFSPNDR